MKFQPLFPAAVLGLIRGGIRHGALDLVFRQVRAAGDGDVLLPPGAEVFGGDLHDAVDVDIKGHFDLRLGREAGADAVQLELAQALVVPRKMAFSLQDVDLHAGLHRARRREDLALPGGDHAVAGDERGRHAAQRLNGQGQRGDIHQHKALRSGTGSTGQLAAALQQSALDRCAHGDALVWVQAVAGLAAQQLFDLTLYGRHPGAAAHQQHLAQLAGGDARIPQGILHRLHGAGQQVAGHHLELRAGERQIQMVGAVFAHRNEGQVQLCAQRAGQLLLGLFGLLFQAAHGGGVAAQVDAVGFLELRHRILHDPLIEIIAAQMGVAAGGQHREGAVLDLDDGDIEGAAAQVIDQNLLRCFVVQAIGHRCGRRFVDDAQHVQPRDAACILRGLALAVVEVGGHRDDGFCHRLAEVALGVAADLRQDHGADLLWGQVLAVDVDPVVGTHVALDAGDGAAGVGRDLALGRAAHQTLTVSGKGDHAGGGAFALGIGDDHGLAALDHCHTGIGRSKVDSDHVAHSACPLFLRHRFFSRIILPISYDDFIEQM